MECDTEVGLDGHYRSRCVFPAMSDLTAAIVVVILLSLVLVVHTVAIAIQLFRSAGWCGASNRAYQPTEVENPLD